MKQINAPKPRLFLVISLCFSLFAVNAQKKSTQPGDVGKYAGKYEANGMIVQVALLNKSLSLIVPGAPVQKMKPAGANKFKSDAFSDELFLFTEKDGKIESMVSQRAGQSFELKKISDTPDNFNETSSQLTLRKSTKHFILLYSQLDSISVNHIADKLESDYKRILTDFRLKRLPVTTVRIYPDLASFHQGINFPNAPAEVLATAFGKDDFRMVSPNAAGVDSLMLMKGVTHEFTHCVHLNIDYAPNNPRWLWEGVAMYEADYFFDPRELDVIKNKNFPPLSSLGNGMEYMLGYVIIEAIKDIWGFDTVINLIRKRGDAQAAVKLSQDEFEKKIFEYIFRKYIKT
jgi:hypothetical protein